MKKLLYTILLSLGTFLFTACTDYINVDKYFYDQVSLDSAFSKRVYVEGWLSSAYSVMDNIGEYREPFRWASDDLYHPDMKEYVEGNYSADHQLSDDDRKNSRLWKYYEGIRKASTFIDNVDRCPELTMDEKTDLKGQARFLRAYCYWALIRVYGPVPLIPTEGLDVNLSYEELSLPREPFDNVVDFIDAELAETARSLPIKRTVNNLGRPTRGAALGLRARVLLYAASPLFNGNIDFFDVKDCYGNQLVSQTYDETKWAKAAAAAKDVIELAKASNLYELYVIAPKATVLPSQRPPYNELYSDKNYPEGWADVDPLLSYKSIFDGTILGSKNPELIFTRTREGTAHINDWAYQSTPKTLRGNNRLAVTQKQVNAYAMNDGRSITEAASTNDYVTEGFTTQAYAAENPFLPAKVNLMYNNREPRFYASIAYNGSVLEASSASESDYRDKQIFYYRGLNDGKQGFKEECPLTGITLKKFYNSEDSRTEGGYLVDKTEMTIRYGEILLIYAEAMIEQNLIDDSVLKAINMVRARAYGVNVTATDSYPAVTTTNQTELRRALRIERRMEFAMENQRLQDLMRWKLAGKALNGYNYIMLIDPTELLNNIVNKNLWFWGMTPQIDEDGLADFAALFNAGYCSQGAKRIFPEREYLWPLPTHDVELCPNLLPNNPGY